MKKILRKRQLFLLKSFFLTFFTFSIGAVFATTYYSKTTGNANTLSTWGVNNDGTGTAPSNFSTNGDVFVLRSVSNLTMSNDFTIGSGVRLEVRGLLRNLSKNQVITINGVIEFYGTTANQVVLASDGTGGGADFILSSGATLKTANTNGVSCSDCSLPVSAGRQDVTLSNSANYEFFGATQNTNGLPSTINNLTIRSTGTVTLAADADVNGTLEIVSGTLNASNKSINVAGNWIKNGGAFNGGTATVTFDGTALQTIGGTSLTTFNNIAISNASGVAFAQSGSTSGLTLTNGKLFIRPGFTLTKNTPSAV